MLCGCIWVDRWGVGGGGVGGGLVHDGLLFVFCGFFFLFTYSKSSKQGIKDRGKWTGFHHLKSLWMEECGE